MAAPTPTPTHSVPPSTSPAPAAYDHAAYATFMHSVLTEMLSELKAVRKELQDMRRQQPQQQQSTRKRKRPTPTTPCALCRFSGAQCIASRDDEACARCVQKQVECWDDRVQPARQRMPREDDAEDESEQEEDKQWQYPPTPAKRVPKACAECHARKRKCTGGPNCGARNASTSRSPHKTREPCAECRGRKRRCIHIEGKEGEEPAEDVPETEPEPERLPVPTAPSSAPSHSHSPPPNRWYPAPPPPPPHWYPDQRVPPYPAHAPFIDRPYPHHPHPPPHLHPHHPRLPPAPDMRHPATEPVLAPPAPPPQPAPPSSKAATPAPAAPAPAGRKGRACLACRKLKMRCVAPNEDGGPDERCQRCERAGLECVYVDRKRRGPGGIFPPGQDGYGKDPGYTPKDGFEFDNDPNRSAKKLKREGSPSSYPENGRIQQDAARALEESFDEDPEH